jgi:glycosyltransferase involved in cell wall biosynthesis
MPYISVISPVYNAKDCLFELYNRLVATLGQINASFEILLVDDRSEDGSWEIITQLCNTDKRVKAIQLSRNFGQHYAITAGLDYCSGAWVVVMDCDLQDQPEEIIRLYQKAHEGFDVVFAKRMNRQDSFMKKLSSWLFKGVFSYLVDTHYDHHIANFFIMRRQVVAQYQKLRERLRFTRFLIHWLGFDITSIEVAHARRLSGKSSYSFRKLRTLARDSMLACSDKPLRLIVKLGFFISLVSFIFGIYIIIKALRYHVSVMGWSSLMVSIYFIGGIIIALLGVIGVYLGKTFDETKGRPLYVIKNVTNFGEE